MRNTIIFTTTLSIFTAFLPISQASAANSDQMPKNASTIDIISYSLGHELGDELPSEIDVNAFIIGLRAGHAHEPTIYSDEELQAASAKLQQQLESKQQAEAKKAEASAKKFFSENAKKPGVITTASGLQYKVLKEGKGKRPSKDSMVTVHYKGQLIDGKEFDNSYKRGEPVEFALNQVIDGWTEGLQLIKEGGKATLYIPAKLGYGSEANQLIPANSILIFDVELIKVK